VPVEAQPAQPINKAAATRGSRSEIDVCEKLAIEFSRQGLIQLKM
jgi:hypothetical protein